MDQNDHRSALLNWLSAGAPGASKLDSLCSEIGRRLGSSLEGVDQVGIYTTVIHPEIPGSYCYWTPEGGADFFRFNAEQLASDVWMGCPAQVCCERGRVINHVLEETLEYQNRPETKLFLEKGYKQIFYAPLLSNYTLINNAVGFGTKSRFTDDHQLFLRLLQGPLARVVEAIVLYEGTEQILSTYVGRDAGSRVLQGNILRGDVESIPSIVLFVDLCGYTDMSNTLPPNEMITRLNVFFDQVGTVVEERGGEILKFLGDGVLAIFPTPDDLNAQTSAAVTASAALSDLEQKISESEFAELRFRASLDVGEIYYGNIGTTKRMDFTAIGPTVNRAARLLTLAGKLGVNYICSAEFQQLLPRLSETLGYHNIKGFEGKQIVYRLTP